MTTSSFSLAKGWQTIAGETSEYSKKSFENGSSFFEKLLGAKSFESSIQVQSEYAKTFFENENAGASDRGASDRGHENAGARRGVGEKALRQHWRAQAGEVAKQNPSDLIKRHRLCSRASQRPYRVMFEGVWGLQAFAIAWPSDVEQACSRPGPPPTGEPMPVHLGPIDRGRVGTTFGEMAQPIVGYEASAEVTAFTSKFDVVLAGQVQFTTQEHAGYDLFRGKARCNASHRDGGPGEDPLFTDFTASNIEPPANPRLPYYMARCTGLCRQSGRDIVRRWRRRQFSHQGATAQPALRGRSAMAQARQITTREFGCRQLRNVDKRPYPAFVKAYMHNEYFTSLKAIVHFYNTRDILPCCQSHDVHEGTTRWPAPELTDHTNTSRVGRLGLPDAEEDAIVSFMQMLTDGFMHVN